MQQLEPQPKKETILKTNLRVQCTEADAPGRTALGGAGGRAIGWGTMTLTDQRLVFINASARIVGDTQRQLQSYAYATIPSAGVSVGAQQVMNMAVMKAGKVDLDDIPNLPGSFSIPLEEITKAETVRFVLLHFVRVSSQSPGLKPVHGFYFFGRVHDWKEAPAWVDAIDSAIAARSPQTTAQPTIFVQPPPPPAVYGASPPPPPPPPTGDPCPRCGGPTAWVAQYNRWYCTNERQNV